MAPFAIRLLLLVLFIPKTECQNNTVVSILTDFPQWLYDVIFGALPFGFSIPPDIQAQLFMEPTARIATLGLTAENHTVTTPDGYNLNFYRIPNTSSEAITILLMHGLGTSSDEFITALNYSPAYQLYQQGFDVWLGNWRGSPFTNHTIYTTQDKEFWNFSFEDMAYKDLPPAIDYILNVTGKSKLVYAGHSMGTIVGFCFFSSHPEYNSKVSSFVALSPVANVRYSPMLFYPLYATAEITMPLLEALGQYSFFATSPQQLQIVISACTNPKNYELCEIFFSTVAGWNPYYHNQTRLPIYLATSNYGSSTKNFKHIGQIVRFNGLRHFDYGETENLQRYNSTIPPKFDLTTMEVPTFVYAGPNDPPADRVDMTFALTGVGAAQDILVDKPMFCHNDMAYANTTPTVLWPIVVSNIHQIYDL